jgi:hypothetical protein
MLLLVLIPILGSHINEKNQKKKREEKTQKYQKMLEDNKKYII